MAHDSHHDSYSGGGDHFSVSIETTTLSHSDHHFHHESGQNNEHSSNIDSKHFETQPQKEVDNCNIKHKKHPETVIVHVNDSDQKSILPFNEEKDFHSDKKQETKTENNKKQVTSTDKKEETKIEQTHSCCFRWCEETTVYCKVNCDDCCGKIRGGIFDNNFCSYYCCADSKRRNIYDDLCHSFYSYDWKEFFGNVLIGLYVIYYIGIIVLFICEAKYSGSYFWSDITYQQGSGTHFCQRFSGLLLWAMIINVFTLATLAGCWSRMEQNTKVYGGMKEWYGPDFFVMIGGIILSIMYIWYYSDLSQECHGAYYNLSYGFWLVIKIEFYNACVRLGVHAMDILFSVVIY